MSSARSASSRQRPESVGGLGEPAAHDRKASQQLLDEDLVDAERPDLLGPPDGPLALVPATQPEEAVGHAAQHVHAEEAHRARAARSLRCRPRRTSMAASSRPVSSSIQVQLA